MEEEEKDEEMDAQHKAMEEGIEDLMIQSLGMIPKEALDEIEELTLKVLKERNVPLTASYLSAFLEGYNFAKIAQMNGMDGKTGIIYALILRRARAAKNIVKKALPEGF